MSERTETSRRPALTELQEWYLGSLAPRLADAAKAGKVERPAVAALDRELREFLSLPVGVRREAA